MPHDPQSRNTTGYQRIDADGHILEVPDNPEALYGPPGDTASSSTILGGYVDPAFREDLPLLFVDSDGATRLRIGEEVFGGEKGCGVYGSVGMTSDARKGMRYPEGRKGGFDPNERITDLDIDDIDAAFLYPTLGFMTGGIKDPSLSAALCRAYNRWLADYCSAHPDRLFGVAMLPMQSLEHGIAEMKYAREQLGMRGCFIRPNPYNDLLLSDAQYDTLWAAAQDLDISIGVHEGAGGWPWAGSDRVHGLAPRHIVSHTVEMMIASLHIIWGGVCERFPDLRFAFLESGGGWMASWIDRMDRHFLEKSFLEPDTAIRELPSEYFKRQCWVSIEPTEHTLPYLAEYLGGNKLLWATDYPHLDGFFPGAPKLIADMLPEDQKQPVLAQGAIEFYNL